MNQKVNPFIVFILIASGPLIVLGATYLAVQFFILQPVDPAGAELVFEIEPGQRGVTIIQQLQDEGLIKNSYAFFSYSFITNRYHQMKAGRYQLSPAMTAAEILDLIIQGRSLPEVVITFPEGLNLEQWQEKIEDYFPEIDLLSYRVGQFQDDFNILEDAPAEDSLEGYLYPDTYYFNYQTDGELMIHRFLNNFNYQLGDLIQTARERGENIHDLVIVASLLEKEVPSADQPLVAGIIQKRLEIGMPLQIDATITYITGQFGERVSLIDTEIDSPYNTYRYRGLPYGPIASFGRLSLEAALNPESSDYLFYLSKPDGETVFSRTLTEHNQAKARYLK